MIWNRVLPHYFVTMERLAVSLHYSFLIVFINLVLHFLLLLLGLDWLDNGQNARCNGGLMYYLFRWVCQARLIWNRVLPHYSVIIERLAVSDVILLVACINLVLNFLLLLSGSRMVQLWAEWQKQTSKLRLLALKNMLMMRDSLAWHEISL